jgi:heme-degrading monooxygenase HmoA
MRLTIDSVTLINPFEVPLGADEPFVAGWERARDFLAARDGFGATALHRALRDDVDFRFVDVARVDSPGVWRRAVGDPAFPGREIRFASHPGLYEVAHEDGAPDGSEGVVLINAFEVEPEADDAFLAAWQRARTVLAAQPGYQGTRLHSSLGAGDFRFVDIARWSSPLAFAKATDRPEFREAGGALPFASHPALYLVVRE